MPRSVDTPPSRCPKCGTTQTRAKSIDADAEEGDMPCPGDFSVCLDCGELLCFDGRLALRLPTAEERVEALDYPELQAVMARIRGMRRN